MNTETLYKYKWHILAVVTVIIVIVVIVRYKSSSASQMKLAKQPKNYGYKLSKQSAKTTKLGITPVKTKKFSISARQSPIPKSFSWGEVVTHDLYPKLLAGNYLSVVRNQHAENYLGICWIIASLQSLASRINIMYALQNGKQRSPLDLSPQQVLNCTDDSIHTLTGGDAFICYDYIMKNYIVDESVKPLTGTTDKAQCLPIAYTCLAEGQTDCSEVGSIEPPGKYIFMDHQGDANYDKREGKMGICS